MPRSRAVPWEEWEKLVTNEQSRLETLRASLSNMTYGQTASCRGTEVQEVAGGRAETLSKISTDEIKTHCRLACTLYSPKRSRLGLLSLGFGVLPILLYPLELAGPPLSSPVLAASISQQPLISTPESPASIWQAVGGFDGLLFLNMKLIWFFRVMAGKQNLPISFHTRPPEAIRCVLQLCHHACCL